jgi:hypothetical protein
MWYLNSQLTTLPPLQNLAGAVEPAAGTLAGTI